MLPAQSEVAQGHLPSLSDSTLTNYWIECLLTVSYFLTITTLQALRHISCNLILCFPCSFHHGPGCCMVYRELAPATACFHHKDSQPVYTTMCSNLWNSEPEWIFTLSELSDTELCYSDGKLTTRSPSHCSQLFSHYLTSSQSPDNHDNSKISKFLKKFLLFPIWIEVTMAFLKHCERTN